MSCGGCGNCHPAAKLRFSHAAVTVGNDIVGLDDRHQVDHPTTVGYKWSTVITPPFFLMTREFLERPGDLQVRNAIVLRNYNSPVLRAPGVCFAITDAPIDGDAILRIRIA